MKTKLFVIFSLIAILSVAEYRLYKRYHRAPASETEYIEPGSNEDFSFEEYVEKTTPHLAELGYSAERHPSDDTSPTWKEGKSGEIFQAITDPRILTILETKGYRLQDLLLGKGTLSSITKNSEFYKKQSLYKNFVDLTTEDIQASVTEENKYRFEDWKEVTPSMKSYRRNLNPKWLSATNSHYELVGIINRMDRMVFDKRTCGELRFIYRLSYESPKIQSRLPLTINMIYNLDRTGAPNCSDIIAQWKAPNDLTPESFSQWLINSGPLRLENIAPAKRRSLETNYQVIRSSAAIRNLLGGNAEYVLRVFKFEDEKLVRGYLENTVDYARLNKNPELKKELLDFLKKEENFDKLDRGILDIPIKFLAQKMSSFAPHGIARMENRVFNRVFTEDDFKDLNYESRQFVRTPDAALRRLNDLSCVGCHQNRTIAGFHFLGVDREGTHPLNAVFFAGSGHFRSELNRRAIYLNTLNSGNTPSDDRPFSIAPTSGKAKYGDFCGLPGSKGFANWVCDTGLSCQLIDAAIGEKELGKCFPDKRLSGDPCIQNSVTQDHHSLDKMLLPTTTLNCNGGKKDYVCQIPGGGFPSGMCTAKCDDIQDKNREICGVIAGNGFNDCIAKGVKTFAECFEAAKATASRGLCNNDRACRNDYICAKIKGKEYGACLPTYFLFQVRVDGHPLPN